MYSKAAHGIFIDYRFTTSLPTEITLDGLTQIADEFLDRYYILIEANYQTATERGQRLITWRKNVMQYYDRLKKRSLSDKAATCFLIVLYYRKIKTDIPLELLSEIKTATPMLITPASKSEVIIQNIADDPNGSLQIKITYNYNRNETTICI